MASTTKMIPDKSTERTIKARRCPLPDAARCVGCELL
jgi:hypothetical protein